MRAKALELESGLGHEWATFFHVVSYLNIRDLVPVAILKVAHFPLSEIYNFSLCHRQGVQSKHYRVLSMFRHVKLSTGVDNETDVGKHWICRDKYDNKCLKCGIVSPKIPCEKWYVFHCTFCDEFKTNADCKDCGKEYLEYLLRSDPIVIRSTIASSVLFLHK